MRSTLFLICFLSGLASTYAQDFKIFKGDTINRTDSRGLKQGVWKRFYDNDQLFSETTFKNGKAVGVAKMYYKTGEKQGMMIYSKDGKSSFMMSFWPNGQRKAIGKYSNQEKDSTWSYYNELDTLTSIENYKAGKPHGKWVVFFPDGKISEETMYANGLKNGPFKKYFTNGNLKMLANYKNDTLEGELIHFHMNGKPYIKGKFSGGLKVGEWVYFSESGTRDSADVFLNGVLQEK